MHHLKNEEEGVFWGHGLLPSPIQIPCVGSGLLDLVSFFSRSSISLSLAVVSTGLADPKIDGRSTFAFSSSVSFSLFLLFLSSSWSLLLDARSIVRTRL